MMSYTDYAAQARSHRSRAAAATRRAERDAQFAAEQYESARNWTRHAQWLTSMPGNLSRYSTGPAEAEETARILTHLADTFLRASFASDERAVDYRDMAARYRQMDADRKARWAEVSA